MKKPLALAFTLLATVLSIGVAYAAKPVFLRDFRLHDFDAAVLNAVGDDSTGSIAYYKELAAITEEQARVRRQYEPIGCNPFYVMRNNKVAESGYNCRSFFCVGYQKGPRVCRDSDGKVYGGGVEISRRLGLVTIADIRKSFDEYPNAERTEAMKKSIDDLRQYRCKPFYLLEFDVVVGEGYECEEIGQYPRYSGNFSCVDDYRGQDGRVCSITIRSNEMDLRADIVKRLPNYGSASSSGASSSDQASSDASTSAPSASSESSSSSKPPVVFADIEQGKYGYTAIVSLATEGVIKGYPDGTYRPKRSVNRAEFLRLLVQGLHPSKLQTETFCFPDVREEWFAPAVCAAWRLNWVRGYGDGFFHPERTMTRAEGIKVVVASLDVQLDSSAALPLGTPDGQWYTPYIRKAVELGIILEPNLSPLTEMTRADAAVWMYRAQKVMNDEDQ